MKYLTSFNLSEQQIKQYDTYAHLLIETNKVMNLTAIDDYDEILEKHFYDCLLIKQEVEGAKTFCDVGSGAGFPGLVLAIALPQTHFTLVEPTKKRCSFLENVISTCGVKNVTVVNARAEDFVSEKRESFDVVSARAVANLIMLSELCLPLVSLGGKFIAMKGLKGPEEIDRAQKAITLLGGKVNEPKQAMLSDGSLRYNITIDKIKKTPNKYPRPFSLIKKNPIN